MARDQGAEAVAVCLMYSYADAAAERALAERLRAELRVPVSASSQVVAEFREYERFSTAVLNAFLSPEVARYMGSLADRAGWSGFIDEISVMRSSGGLVSLDHASAFPASILLSGPAGGVVAAAALGELMGTGTLISFDMGGTSTDVCRVPGRVGGQPGPPLRRPRRRARVDAGRRHPGRPGGPCGPADAGRPRRAVGAGVPGPVPGRHPHPG